MLSYMQDEQLKTVDSEDIDDVLRHIETSFSIKFGTHELQHVLTFGELCDIIERKIPFVSTPDCTSQQAFYRLRAALAISFGPSRITPDTSLELLLPSRKRKAIWRSVEKQLGFELDIIGISSAVSTVLFFTFVAALATFFVSAKVAGLCLLVFFLAAFIASKTGNALHAKTVRECVEKMTREQYMKSRRNPGTSNRQEIFPQVQALFVDRLGISASALNRDSVFV